MTELFGSTRTTVKERYALLTPNGFVTSALPGWQGAGCIVAISEAIGAGFCQFLITLGKEAAGRGNTKTTQMFAYVLDGSGVVTIEQKKSSLVRGSYVYVPPDHDFTFAPDEQGARLLIFQKKYEALRGQAAPEPLIKQEHQITALPVAGNADARLQELLPNTPPWDLAVNISTYEPGAALPLVETHVMEHGVLMLEGQGIYRLGEDWHPVREGDVIWIAPYCPQWFVAVGKTPASFLYYSNINRDPLTA